MRHSWRATLEETGNFDCEVRCQNYSAWRLVGENSLTLLEAKNGYCETRF